LIFFIGGDVCGHLGLVHEVIQLNGGYLHLYSRPFIAGIFFSIGRCFSQSALPELFPFLKRAPATVYSERVLDYNYDELLTNFLIAQINLEKNLLEMQVFFDCFIANCSI